MSWGCGIGVKWIGEAGDGLLDLSMSQEVTGNRMELYMRLKSILGEGSNPSLGLFLLV